MQHCMIPSINPAFRPDALPALQREMKLLLIERDLLRTEVEQRRAREDEWRAAQECILAYVEQVEQLSAMEAQARKAMEFWHAEARRIAQKRPHRLLRSYRALRSAVWWHWPRVRHLAAVALFTLIAMSWKKAAQ